MMGNRQQTYQEVVLTKPEIFIPEDNQSRPDKKRIRQGLEPLQWNTAEAS